MNSAVHIPKAFDIWNGSLLDHYDATAPNMLDRWHPVMAWWDARAHGDADPYAKVTNSEIGPRITATDRSGKRIEGLNFATQDCLNLSRHPAVRRAAADAVAQGGLHAGGSAALMGLSAGLVRLEQTIARFLDCDDATVLPTGWAAGYGVIRALVRPQDHVVIDALAHACLFEGAKAATGNVHQFDHNNIDDLVQRLTRIRAAHPAAGILVATESLFSAQSDSPDLAAMMQICRDTGALFLVDTAHDLGATGPTGRGEIEKQGVLRAIDVIMGSFSKTFASAGGFVASNHPALKTALRLGCGPSRYSNALSPVQSAVVQSCFDLVSSPTGSQLRSDLKHNSALLRSALRHEGFDILGGPSPIVPVVLGDVPLSRQITSNLFALNALANLVEFPSVPQTACRWRLQVMAGHSDDDILDFVSRAVTARRQALDAPPPGTVIENFAL